VNDEDVAITLDLLDQVHGLQGSRKKVARHMSGELLSGVG
jgi:hypothetical protein